MQLISTKHNENELFIISNHYGRIYLINLLQLEHVMLFLKLFLTMAHWYVMWNTIIIAINFCNAKKMNCSLMLIISNHNGRKSLSNSLQLEHVSNLL